MDNEFGVGCENCTKCFNGCPNPFPEEFAEGGADKCCQFDEETDPQQVLANMTRKLDEIKDAHAKKGIFL